MSSKSGWPPVLDRLILRDRLALDRTHLSLERTLLAWLRTAFLLLSTGVTVIKFLGENRLWLVIGLALLALAAGVSLAGVIRFRRFRRKLARRQADDDRRNGGPRKNNKKLIQT